ncbi:hypothetical protein ACLBYG_21955 [Methylobacterium sp. D53M]
MADLKASPFPLIAEPPYWRAITPEALGELLGSMPGPADLDQVPGWELALLGLTTAEGRRTVCGWAKGSLSVHLFPSKHSGVDLGSLSHLVTGRSIALFFSDECAAKAGDLIAPLTDWSSDMASPEPGLRDRIASTLRAAGFELVFVGSPDVGFERVWCSRPAGLH